MKLKAFKVIFEDRDNVYREFIPAESPEAAEKIISGNGSIVKIEDVTENFPLDQNAVSNALYDAGFSATQIDLIRRIIAFHYDNPVF